MEAIPHRFFGYIAMQTKVSPGDILNTDPVLDNVIYHRQSAEYIVMVTKGRDIFEKVDTGSTITFEPGDSTLTTILQDGEYRLKNSEYYEFWCISPYLNTDKIPLRNGLTPFKLMAGEEVQILKDSKLFLMEGVLNIGNSNYSGANRIQFTSGNKKVKALTNSYGLIVT